MSKRLGVLLVLSLAAGGLLMFSAADIAPVKLGPEHTLWDFFALSCIALAAYELAALVIKAMVVWRKGTEGEVKMLTGFAGTLSGAAIFIVLLYCLGAIKTVGVVAAGFAGMLLGWSLQAPVSGIAAWVLITLKRPFRVGDRVMFPSLGLNGDVKQVGLMYTVLDQVGGSVGSEEAIGRDILIPNAMLFTQVAINYTPKAEAAYFLDEVVIRITYDSDWDAAEQILLSAAREVTADVIKATGQEPYIRSDTYDYGIYIRLRYMTMAKDRPRIVHEIVKQVFKAVQRDPRVDMAIPYVYSFRKSTAGVMRDMLPEPEPRIEEVPVGAVTEDGLEAFGGEEQLAETDQLMENIRKHGLLQPIMVAPVSEGRYRIIAGHKRFLACRRLGWDTVPVVVREGSGQAEAKP
jgi:small-conductance mechanosensitive channel